MTSSSLDLESVKSSFFVYKNVCGQYKDPRVLRSVRELIPDNIMKEDMVPSLLKWFKTFMRWAPNQVVCNNCSDGGNNNGTKFMEAKVLPGNPPMVGRMEVHTCNRCGAVKVFPRYNDVLKIAETRTGRCGEWTILFGAILNSISLEARNVHDYLDHCWNEVLLDDKWVHVDSTLDYPISLNHPHFYEQNWKKEYLQVLAFTADKVEDVTQKYTEQWDKVLARRQGLSTGIKCLEGPEMQKLYQSIKISS